MRSINRAAGIGYLVIFFAFFTLTAEALSPWGIDELIGKRAPDFVLKDVNGTNVSLASLRGNVVLINFWATWCPPCLSEMPYLNKLYKDYRSKGLVVVAISTDRSSGYVKDYLSSKPLDFPVLMDSDGKVFRQFKAFSLPTSYLLDRNGVIIQRYIGEEEWDSPVIRSKIKTALGIQ